MKLATVTCVVAALWPVAAGAQTVSRSSGGGELSRTVVATWEAHGDPAAPPLGGARTLDLLVLWRGAAGWFATPPSAGGSNQLLASGGSERLHRVFIRGRPLELRIDARTNTAHIQDQAIPLQGSNVLLIDEVDGANVRIAGTLWVDPKLDAIGDPVAQILRQSALLKEFAGR